MGIGPAPASRAALKSAGKSIEDMDIVEVFRWNAVLLHIPG